MMCQPEAQVAATSTRCGQKKNASKGRRDEGGTRECGEGSNTKDSPDALLTRFVHVILPLVLVQQFQLDVLMARIEKDSINQ